MEVLLEATFGKKFKISMMKNGNRHTWLGMATANAKPGERPYRITWFSINKLLAAGIPDNRHIDLTFEEMENILQMNMFPPEIIKRVHDRYPDPNDELIGDEYVIETSPIKP